MAGIIVLILYDWSHNPYPLCEQQFEQKLWTSAVNNSGEEQLWTAVVNNSCEQQLWPKVVNNSR